MFPFFSSAFKEGVSLGAVAACVWFVAPPPSSPPPSLVQLVFSYFPKNSAAAAFGACGCHVCQMCSRRRSPAYLMFDFINTNTDTPARSLSLPLSLCSDRTISIRNTQTDTSLHLYSSCCWDISPWRALTCNRCAPHCAHNCPQAAEAGRGAGDRDRPGNIYDLRRRIVYELHPQSIKLILFDTLREWGLYNISGPYCPPIRYTNRDDLGRAPL